jgi:hypothetical protein
VQDHRKYPFPNLVRRAVDALLAMPTDDGEIRHRAQEAVGFVRDAPDLSVNHDKRLAEAYADEPSA